MSLLKVAGTSGLLGALLCAITSVEGQRQRGKAQQEVVVINIEGSGSAAKYILEGDTEQKPVVVLVGQAVVWHNKDTVKHTATEGTPDADKHLFDTGDIKKGASAKIVFDQQLFQRAGGTPGGEVTLKYYCDIHHQMKSSLILKSSAGK